MESVPWDLGVGAHLVRASGHGVWEWDVVNDVLTTDARCGEIVGCTAYASPRSLWDNSALVHPADREACDRLFRRAAETGGEFEHEYRLRHTRGDWRWIRLCGRALCDDDGRVVRCVGVICDVTDERRLRESEQRLRLAMSAAHDGMWELDVRSGRLWWSDGMFALLGLGDETMPQDVDAACALVHPDDLPTLRDDFRRAGGSPVRGSMRLRHGNGGWRRVESWAVAETDPATGVVTRVAGLVHAPTDGASADRSGAVAQTLSEAVLGPVESAAAQLKLAAVELSASPERAGELLDASAAHLSRARDAVEELILAELLVSRDGGG
jgi:PAS domain-containing protein